jgi:signal transduction histidine kinase
MGAIRAHFMVMPPSSNPAHASAPVSHADDSPRTALAPDGRRIWLGFFGVGLTVVTIVVATMWFAQQVSTQINFVRTQSVPAALTAQLAVNSFEQQRAAYQDVVMTGAIETFDGPVIQGGATRLALAELAAGSGLSPLRRQQLDDLRALLEKIEASAPSVCLALAKADPDEVMRVKSSVFTSQLQRFEAGMHAFALDSRNDTQGQLMAVANAGLRQRNAAVGVLIVAVIVGVMMLRQVKSKLRTLEENARLHADITRRQTELQGILDHAPVSIYTRDPRGCTVLANRRYEQMWHLPLGSVRNGRYADFLAPEIAAQQDAWDNTVLTTGNPHEMEEEINTPQGVAYYWTARHALRNERNQITHVCVVSNDITLNKQAQQVLARSRDELELQVKARTAELEDAQRKIVATAHQAGMAEVASAVLHNIGNVLTGIVVNQDSVAQRARKSQVSLLRQLADALAKQEDPHAWIATHAKGRQTPAFILKVTEALEKERAADVLEHQQITEALEHVRHVLDSQQAHAKGKGFVETVSLPELLEDALNMRASSFNRHSITIERQLAPVEWSVEKHKLLQVLVNLIGNAIDAMHESRERTLTLSVALDEDHAIIKIKDSGIGFTAETHAKLFGFGFTTKATGHGFGLHSCAVETQAMGGHLLAESDGPGLGACFTVCLPRNP